MWDVDALRTVVGLAVAQLFGGKSAPLNYFARFPDWCSHCCSILFLVVFWQCVDDLILMERVATVNFARDVWLVFADLCDPMGAPRTNIMGAHDLFQPSPETGPAVLR